MKVAVIDTGLRAALGEFAGRVDPASRSLDNSGPLDDTEEYHGTAVAGIIAANKNGAGMHGVAYEATILALKTSLPGPAVDTARTEGARVINISQAVGETSVFTDPVKRAAEAGIVMVITAANHSSAEPQSGAIRAAEVGGGHVIIAGAHDANRQIASFSNRAGSGAQYYLAALGVGVGTVAADGGLNPTFFGTSAATPVISGAAALLLSAFPNLSGKQVVEILFRSADDAGAPGIDPVFGNGILNIERAFQPLGQVQMAGSNVPVSSLDMGRAAGAMGDASADAAQMGGAVVLDGYDRAFTANLPRQLGPTAIEEPLVQSLRGNFRTAVAGSGSTAFSMTLDLRQGGQPWVGFAQRGLTRDDAREARPLSGLAVSRLTRRSSVALGLSESGNMLEQHLAGRPQNPFLAARDPRSRPGFYGDGIVSLGARHNLGATALTLTGERGKVFEPDLRNRGRGPDYALASVSLDRRIGPALVTLAGSRLDESETILGGRLPAAFAAGGATSWFADAGVRLETAQGWTARAGYRRGWTSIGGNGGLGRGGRLTSTAWTLDLSKYDLLAGGDRLAFRVTQPLRVGEGGLGLDLPVSYDYLDRSVAYERRFFNLAPTGREIDLEAAYSARLWNGWLSGNAFVRREPGHISGMANDVGGAIRFTLGL